MIREFRKFIARGNVIDLAVGIVIGAAFTSIVRSLVDDIIMPPIGVLLGGVDFLNLFISLSGEEYTSLADAREAGAATINYGLFISAVISFVIVGFAVFLVVQAYNRLQTKQDAAPPPPTEKDCPYCLMRVPKDATKCGHCTSQLAAA